ncbi:hypothetical protein HDV00_000442, partial [Rhizophlyctis rosea]
MLSNSTCSGLCISTVSGDDAKFINERIREAYTMNWFVDGLPAAQIAIDPKTDRQYFKIGFQLGSTDTQNTPFLNNHFDIQIMYHAESETRHRVVGVVVWPYSTKNAKASGCDPNVMQDGEGLVLDEAKDTAVEYTYNVVWT